MCEKVRHVIYRPSLSLKSDEVLAVKIIEVMSDGSGACEGGRSNSVNGVRSRFSKSDDRLLASLVASALLESGCVRVDWKSIGGLIGKTGKQCRERYKNYLSPELDRGPWTASEDALLEEHVKSYGCRWSFMTRFFPRRSSVSLKNRWSALEYGRNHGKLGGRDVSDEKVVLVLSEAKYAFYGPI